MVEISSILVKAVVLPKRANEKDDNQAKWSLLAQKRKFFLNPRNRNDAPTVSNTPPTGNNPKGATDSMRNETTPMLKNIALRQM